MNEITVEIQKLVNGGQGLGLYDGKPVFAWNVLPGETAVIEPTKEKKSHIEGTAVRISNPSPHRVEPEEDHFLSCAPWQIMTFEHENHWKKEIAKETFRRLGGIELPDFRIVHDRNLFGYRNKAEYGFCPSTDGKAISLALHRRGTAELIPVDRCLLASEDINKAAAGLLDRLNEAGKRVGDLKSLILRANREGSVVASLIVTNKKFRLPSEVAGDGLLSGIQVYFSNPKHRAPRLLKLPQTQGAKFITEEVAGKRFKCGPLSFFQVNIELFEKTLAAIDSFVTADDEIVDFYSGVGAIGIALGDKVGSGVLVENNRESAALAAENIRINGLKNFAAHAAGSEQMLSEIKQDRTVIFDPPRAGLHPRVIEKLLEVLPPKIIYLSCDTATQARDVKMLGPKYGIARCEAYNFFPRTPHIESLLVLARR
jgi:23S rRNA (uracil1939-C5)-methyltransferase